jgi:hypothetical protein
MGIGSLDGYTPRSVLVTQHWFVRSGTPGTIQETLETDDNLQRPAP